MRLTRHALFVSAMGVAGLVAFVLALGDDAFTSAAFWVRHVQESLQNGLVHAVEDWRAAPGGGSLAALATACFLYGVFHAVGPGHGKAVLSAYAATARVRLGRVLWLSVLTSAVQATVAIALVGAAFSLAGASMRWVNRQAADVLEPLSYGAIMFVGAWLVVGGIRSLFRLRQRVHAHHEHAPDGACCGHHATLAEDAHDGQSGSALALAAGLRPCTGSLLVVALCFGAGSWGLGIAAAYVIGTGTAITVAALAGGVHMARGPAAALVKVARLPETGWLVAGIMTRLLGGGLVLLLGWIMLQAALNVPRHPFG